MRRLFASVVFMLAISAPAFANQFAGWAVLIVSGDNHAHSGAPSAVFDNARHDLVKAFTAIGFSPANMAQFSVTPDPAAQHAEPGAIANTLWDLTSRAPDGCLIYFTSHGTAQRHGAWATTCCRPARLKIRWWTRACGGNRPAVIVMSACYSRPVRGAAGGRRTASCITAARPDRTSASAAARCDQYTFFDDCFLRALADDRQTSPKPEAGLVQQVRRLSASSQMHASPPSEPQVNIGPNVAFGASNGSDLAVLPAMAQGLVGQHASPSSLRPPARRGCRRRDHGGPW